AGGAAAARSRRDHSGGVALCRSAQLHRAVRGRASRRRHRRTRRLVRLHRRRRPRLWRRGVEIHRSEEHTSELQSRFDLVCRLLLEKKKKKKKKRQNTV